MSLQATKQNFDANDIIVPDNDQQLSLSDSVKIPDYKHDLKCACTLLIDTSGSMAGKKIQALNEAIPILKEEIEQDDLAKKKVELSIITFGNGGVTLTHDFSVVEKFTPTKWQANGGTPMAEAILTATELIEDRKTVYKSLGIDYVRPWIILITDGKANDCHIGDSVWNKVVKTVHYGERDKKFLFFAIGVDKGTNFGALTQIAPPNRPPLELVNIQFKKLFEWLSKSFISASTPDPGTGAATLENPTGPQGWGMVPTTCN